MLYVQFYLTILVDRHLSTSHPSIPKIVFKINGSNFDDIKIVNKNYTNRLMQKKRIMIHVRFYLTILIDSLP